ncbi:MAG: aminotransferase class V-fold PLP-dependent enzyme [Dehalococcoidia bacterium]
MGSPFAPLWGLDPAVAFLNHGSYGATPLAVLEKQRQWRDRMERQPVQFLGRDLRGLLESARTEVADYIRCDPADLGFVPNATTGVNTVLRWLRLEPGDELLTTNHAYGACRNALEATALWTGAKVVVADVPFPLESEDDVVDAILGAVSPRTKVAVLDHVTSPTAMVLPIQRLVLELAARGVETLVDGAHAPGMVEVDVASLGAAWYTGNGHKWLCSPKGAGFLHVRRNLQEGIHPLVISHGATSPLDAKSRFEREFEWVGTLDPTAYLGLSDSIRYIGSVLPGGWPEVRGRNRALALEARDILCGALALPAPCPDSMLGSMATLPLPTPSRGSPAREWQAWDWQRELLARGFELPVLKFPPGSERVVLRVSAQLYNSRDEYVRLAATLEDLLAS